MASYCHVTVMGNVCRDAEIRYTPKGTAIANISLAVNRKWKNDQGELQDEVSFFDCTAFGRTAEVAGQYVRKGNPLLIDGRLKQETWDDRQTGQKRSKVVIIVENLVLCGQKRDGQPDDPGAPPPARGRAPSPAADTATPPVEDDVPF